jgi:peptide/nickel transport system substrate-binding protein
VASVDRSSGRVRASVIAAMFAVSACSPSPSPSPTSIVAPAPSTTGQATPGSSVVAGPRPGGTIRLLSWYQEFNQVDPQRIYTYEDLAFFGATIQRSLVAYATSPDPVAGTTLVPDMATDLGRPEDGGRTWSFTLRDGVTWQDGSDVTCEDVKYGVSRTFANDLINQGPTYAIAYLDIPANAITDPNDSKSTYLSAYYGPYDGTGQDLFDRAVQCSTDHRTITFHLKEPIADFNATTTLGFFPVPKAADSGETYGQPGHLAWSTGPYKVETYIPGSSGKLVLVRNPNWEPASDPIRHAYPDRWEVDLGVEAAAVDQRLMAAVGDDATAIDYLPLITDSVPAVFETPDLAKPAFASRAVAGFDQYARYDWIDTTRVPNVKLRQAMLVALDRQAVREAMGGAFAGTFADGVMQPTIGRDYAPTGIWGDFFGQPIPTTGDPELAKRLIAESGETPPTLKFRIPDTPTNQEVLAAVQESLGKAGFIVEWDPPCEFCAAVFTDTAHFGTAGWGADWPSASTVLPPLFTLKGGWDLSKVDNSAFNAAVEDAFATLDRDAQAAKWRGLHREAIQQAWVIPTVNTRTYRLAGTKVGPIYLWPAYASWPYAEMYVTE